MPRQFDITEVIATHWHGPNSERAELIKEFKEQVTHGTGEFKLFLAEVAEEVYKNNLPPIGALGCAMMYGMVIGVLAERRRREKEKRLIV